MEFDEGNAALVTLWNAPKHSSAERCNLIVCAITLQHQYPICCGRTVICFIGFQHTGLGFPKCQPPIVHWHTSDVVHWHSIDVLVCTLCLVMYFASCACQPHN